LRAGPLSDTSNIELLNDRFVNTWALNNTVKDRRDKAATADTRRLAQVLLDAKLKGSPVDCLVLTPDLTLVTVRETGYLLDSKYYGKWPERYREFLTGALEKAKR
jgi:hypothetical protein